MCVGGELSGSINHLASPQVVTLNGRPVNVSNFKNLINSKLKTFQQRQADKDAGDLDYLVERGKGKYKVDDIDQTNVKFFCENYPNAKKNKDRRKKTLKGLEHKDKLKKLAHACSIQ